MKKILSIILAMCLLLILCACAKSTNKPEPVVTETPVHTEDQAHADEPTEEAATTGNPQESEEPQTPSETESGEDVGEQIEMHAELVNAWQIDNSYYYAVLIRYTQDKDFYISLSSLKADCNGIAPKKFYNTFGHICSEEEYKYSRSAPKTDEEFICGILVFDENIDIDNVTMTCKGSNPWTSGEAELDFKVDMTFSDDLSTQKRIHGFGLLKIGDVYFVTRPNMSSVWSMHDGSVRGNSTFLTPLDTYENGLAAIESEKDKFTFVVGEQSVGDGQYSFADSVSLDTGYEYYFEALLAEDNLPTIEIKHGIQSTSGNNIDRKSVLGELSGCICLKYGEIVIK